MQIHINDRVIDLDDFSEDDLRTLLRELEDALADVEMEIAVRNDTDHLPSSEELSQMESEFHDNDYDDEDLDP